jgi:hypothetical protein
MMFEGAGGFAMTLSRALSLAVFAAAVSIPAAKAQSDGKPGMPNVLGMCDAPGGPGFPPKCVPPPGCLQVLTLRGESQKNANAIRAITEKANARHKPPDPVETCKLFEAYLANESKFIKGLQTYTETCGFPADALKQAQEGYGKASEIGKQVCNAADRSSAAERSPEAPFIWDSNQPVPGAPFKWDDGVRLFPSR